MSELESALRELDVEWPATPDLATTLRGRLDAPVAHRRALGGWRARLAYAAAALVLLAGGTLAASPEARSTVLRWLGLESVEIRRGPVNPSAGRDLNLGRPIALRSGTRVPAALGKPDAVYETVLPDGTKIPSLVYAGPPEVLVQTFRARATPFIEKTLGTATTAQRLTVGGAPAYWITGSHGFAFQSPSGEVVYEDQRLADRTLLVERGGVLTRIEGRISRARAVEIARSIK